MRPPGKEESTKPVTPSSEEGELSKTVVLSHDDIKKMRPPGKEESTKPVTPSSEEGELSKTVVLSHDDIKKMRPPGKEESTKPVTPSSEEGELSKTVVLSHDDIKKMRPPGKEESTKPVTPSSEEGELSKTVVLSHDDIKKMRPPGKEESTKPVTPSSEEGELSKTVVLSHDDIKKMRPPGKEESTKPVTPSSEEGELSETMTNEIRKICNSDPSEAEIKINDYVEQKLKEHSSNEKLNFLKKLTSQFRGSRTEDQSTFNIEADEFSQLISLFLGKNISNTELSSSELLEKLASSSNAAFNTLNEIINMIQTTLLGKEGKHKSISGDLKSKIATDSLQDYLDQIKDAFSIYHQAFQKASHAKMKTILDGLDPERISTKAEGGFKFRKADLFKDYKKEYKSCKKWFDSASFNDGLLREFEKVCQKLYKKKERDR